MVNSSSSAYCCAIVAFLLIISAGPVRGAGECDPIPKATGPITRAYVVAAPDAQVATSPPTSETVELGRWIAVGVTDREKFLRESKCRSKSAVVYLNGHVMKGMELSGGVIKDTLYFQFLRASEDRAAWSEILGSPSFVTRRLNITVGIDGEPPLSTESGGPLSLELKVLTWPPVIFAGVIFIALIAGFFMLIRRSNILRDAAPPEDAIAIVHGRFNLRKSAVARGTYSLAKLQAAWWFFIVVGAYLLIGIVTWDFYSSISSTALILLGIGAGTVVGGTLIDTLKDTPDVADASAKRTAELRSRIVLLDAAEEYCDLNARRLDELDPPSAGGKPFTFQEGIRLGDLKALYGNDIAQWLRTSFGVNYTAIAQIFEFQALIEQQVAQAAALAAGAPAPAPSARLLELEAVIVERFPNGMIVELCRIKALNRAKQPVPQSLADLVPRLPSFASLTSKASEVSDLTIEKNIAISRYRKLTSQSESWFIDILSDAYGVNFHRFQLFSWTLILGVIFVGATYVDLNMPVFDTTLMGLLGLSAATYLGLKVPEPVVPPK